jgi:hypothetical protein
MPIAGFKPAITASERLIAVHASERSATATGTARIFMVSLRAIMSRVGVTISWVWIGEWIYWPRLGTRSYYSATATLHKSQVTVTHAKPFLACRVFTSRSLTTAYNSGDSSASRAQVLSSQPPVQNCQTTNFVPCL